MHVTSPFVGGGFGNKTLWQHHDSRRVAAARLGHDRFAWSWCRAKACSASWEGARSTEQRVAIGAQPDGRFDALIQTGVVAMTSITTTCPEPFILPAKSCIYSAGSFKLDVKTTRSMDMLANTFMRAPGESVGTFGLESAD